jgi:hypothetical protein
MSSAVISVVRGRDDSPLVREIGKNPGVRRVSQEFCQPFLENLLAAGLCMGEETSE